MTRPDAPRGLLVIPRHIVHEATDSAVFGELIRLYEVADNAWPNPAPVPRWVDADRLAALVDSGSVTLHEGDRFTVPAVEENRQRQRDWHAHGGKARAEAAGRDGGRFTSSDQQGPAGHQQDTSRTPASAGAPRSADQRSPAGHQQQPAAAGESPADVDVDVDDSREGESGSTTPPGFDSARASAGRRQTPPPPPPASRNGNGESDGWAGFGPEWRRVRTAWAKKSLRLPPTEPQRALIAQLVRERPEDVAFAIDELPLMHPSSFEVIEWILERLGAKAPA